MIDVGGPSMLRAAAKNFAHVVAGLDARAVRPRARRAARPRRALARARGARSPREAFATTAAYDAAIARWFGETRAVPGAADAQLPEGRRPPVRREPAPARRLLRARSARAGTCSRASSSSAAGSSRTTTSPTSTAPAASLARVRAAGRRDRQAREPVRRRGRRLDRGGVRARARRRPGLRVRLRRSSLNRPVARALGARIAEHFVEVLLAPDFDDEALEALRAKTALRILARPRAPHRDAAASATTSACSAACSCRSATPTSTTASRWTSSRARRARSSGATCSSPGGSAST